MAQRTLYRGLEELGFLIKPHGEAVKAVIKDVQS